MTAAPITGLCSLLVVVSTTAFVPTLQSRSSFLTQQISSDASFHLTKLNASKKKTKKSASTAKNKSGGGFGSSSPTATKPRQNDKSIQYPELEPQVRQTLIPSPYANSEDSATVLAEEMYDRLEDIYGLEKFNFGGAGAIYRSIGVVSDDDDGGADEKENGDAKEGGSSSLFDDILSASGSASTTGGGSDPLEELFGKSPVTLRK